MSTRSALVIDDSKSARFALRKYLESHAYEVQTAESAEEALSLLRRGDGLPQVIFLDHVMPGTDGFTALEHIKADPRLTPVPVVICSSSEGEAFVAEARSRGAADVLQKPPSPDQLARILENLQSLSTRLREEQELAARPAPRAEPTLPSRPRVAPIREPSVAIEQAVMRTLKSAMAPPNPTPAAAPATAQMGAALPPVAPASQALAQGLVRLREQLEARISTETAPLREALEGLRTVVESLAATINGADDRLTKTRAELEAAMAEAQRGWLGSVQGDLAALQAQIDLLEQKTESRLQDLRNAVEQAFQEQAEQIEALEARVRAAAADEAHHVAERAVMAAATRISEQMAESILAALGQTPR